MIFEVAIIDIKEGKEEEFERGVADALRIFRRARGCRSVRLERVIETPSRFRLVVGWDTIEDHVEHFRNSKDFELWRSLVGHTFSSPPSVDHARVVIRGFDAEQSGD